MLRVHALQNQWPDILLVSVKNEVTDDTALLVQLFGALSGRWAFFEKDPVPKNTHEKIVSTFHLKLSDIFKSFLKMKLDHITV